MHSRDLAFVIKRILKSPTVLISGPRKTGKTAFAKSVFKSHKYVSFADTDTRLFAANDPERFLNFYKNPHGMIIDDVHHFPEIIASLRKYGEGIDTEVSQNVLERKRVNYFVLISSERLAEELLEQKPKLSMFTLLPPSLKELLDMGMEKTVDQQIIEGSYPAVCENFLPEYYQTYIHEFVEIDVRLRLLEKNVLPFYKFMQLCASQIGTILNLDIIAEECGISYATARQWLALLEHHFFVFLLPAHTADFQKRITKTPKLYFFDTGIAASLLRIATPDVLALHPLRPALFENLVIADFYKQFCMLGRQPALSYWRDQNGRISIDCIIDTGTTLIALDIKSGESLTDDAFKILKSWNKISGSSPTNNIIVYGGALTHETEDGISLGWRQTNELIDTIAADL